MLDTRGLSQSLMTDDYFSNMNPRAMKRIVNALTLTGRYEFFFAIVYLECYRYCDVVIIVLSLLSIYRFC